MKKEDIPRIAELLSSLKNTLSSIENAKKNKNSEALNAAKKEALEIQKNIDKLL